MAALRLSHDLKGIPISALPEEAWTQLTGSAASGDVLEFYRRVPWLYRAIHLRADAIRRLPYTVRIDGDEVPLDDFDLSAALGYQLRLREVLAQLEGHQALFGASYADLERNAYGRSKGFRVLHPLTIRPKIDRRAGLVGFTRSVGSETVTYSPEDIVYIWQINLEQEIGPGTSPAQAALAAAGMLRFIQEFGRARFERGAFRPLLLLVPDNTGEADRERLENWARRMLSGIRNAFSIAAAREGVRVVEIGSEIGDLAMPDLTRLQREEIATALGIPQTLLFSNAANYATSENDYRQFYDTTIIPEAQHLLEALNKQLLDDYGIEIVEAHERLEFYQEDKERGAERLFEGFRAGVVSPSEVRDWLDLPEFAEQVQREIIDWTRTMTLARSAQAADISVMPAPPPPPQPEPPAAEAGPARRVAAGAERGDMREELERWQRKALRRLAEGKHEKAVEFESSVIPDELAEAVRGALQVAETAEDVKAAFAWAGYPVEWWRVKDEREAAQAAGA